MNSLRTYLEQKGGKKGAINTNFDTIRNGRTTNGIQVMMTFPVPFISTLSTSLPYRVRSVVMRAKVREFNVISFLICDSWNSPELSSSLPPSPSLPPSKANHCDLISAVPPGPPRIPNPLDNHVTKSISERRSVHDSCILADSLEFFRLSSNVYYLYLVKIKFGWSVWKNRTSRNNKSID